MGIHNPPFYRYALSDQWSKDVFFFINKLAKSKNFPKIVGTKEEKNEFIVMLIRTQKSLHGWQKFLKDTLDQIRKTGTVNTKVLIKKYPPESVSKKIPEWVTYPEDKTVSDFIDELGTRKIDFIGDDRELGEFVLRFILGQLGHDWESTILMIWEMLEESNTLLLTSLNKEMHHFDYLHLFQK